MKESNRKPNKIWVDKGSEFYNNSLKKWLKDNDILMFSIHNDGKSVVAQKFIRTLKTKIYKYMTSISQNVCIDKLDDIVGEYNDTYHRTIKINLLKDAHQIGLKKFLLLAKWKTQFYGHMLLTILTVKKLLEHFMKNKYKRLFKMNSE